MPVQRLIFAPPAAFGDAAETARLYARWFDEYRATLGGRDFTPDPEAPFTTRVEYVALGPIGLSRQRGTIKRLERRREHIRRDGDDRLMLVINRGRGASHGQQRGQPSTVLPRAATLFDFAEPLIHYYPADRSSLSLHVPRRLMAGAVPRAEDLAGIVIPSGNEALHVLSHYADTLLDAEITEPAVMAQAGQSLLDLAALAFGTSRDGAEAARLRGLRAARLAAVLRCIRLDFADPALSPADVARRVRISTRTLHALLHETGASFSERVLELRLAKAFTLLCGPVKVVHTVSDAAYAAGFSDLSYFNRLFRRRYGMTPTAARGKR